MYNFVDVIDKVNILEVRLGLQFFLFLIFILKFTHKIVTFSSKQPLVIKNNFKYEWQFKIIETNSETFAHCNSDSNVLISSKQTAQVMVYLGNGTTCKCVALINWRYERICMNH